MGDYLNEMNQKKIGDEKVKAALKDLKDLHRNPLIHPEHSLESADEAIALMNGVHTVMVYAQRNSGRCSRACGYAAGRCYSFERARFAFSIEETFLSARSNASSSVSAPTSSAISINLFDCSGSSCFVGLRGMNQSPSLKGNLSCRGSSRQCQCRLRGRLYRSALAPIEQSCFVSKTAALCLPAPPRSPAQTGISRFSANRPELPKSGSLFCSRCD
jgi:hypothetical protein